MAFQKYGRNYKAGMSVTMMEFGGFRGFQYLGTPIFRSMILRERLVKIVIFFIIKKLVRIALQKLIFDVSTC